MKLKRYEKKDFLFFSCCLLFSIELIFFFIFYLQKMPFYVQISGVVRKENVIVVIVSTEELTLLYQNQYLYNGDKKMRFMIEDVTKGVLKRNNKKYHEVVLKFNSFSQKENDICTFAVLRKRIRGIEIFKIIWGGTI